MTTTTHTPGPWSISQFNPLYVLAGSGDERTTIAESRDKCTERAEAEANARLIAAAPDLLAALESALSALSQMAQSASLAKSSLPMGSPLQNILAYDIEEVDAAARAAITKARA